MGRGVEIKENKEMKASVDQIKVNFIKDTGKINILSFKVLRVKK